MKKTLILKTQTALTLACTAALFTVNASSAFADPAHRPMIVMPMVAEPATPAAIPGNGVTIQSRSSNLCGPFDPECARRLQRILTGIHALPVQVSTGVRFGENGAQGAVRISTQVVGLDLPSGDASALMFDAVYLPDAGGLRVRFTLAETDVLFFCKDFDNKNHPPVAAIFENCRPEGIVGIGGSLVQVQWDTASERVVARWAEINAVLNFLRNGNGLDYLKHRLNGFLGASVDTIWYGMTPQTTGGSQTIVRANVGVTGMLRSDNNHWEIRGLAGYRPNVTDWSDFSIEVRTQALYHMLFSRDVMGDFGLDASYNYNSVPAHSFGQYASDREQHSAFLGAMFGITWQ